MLLTVNHSKGDLNDLEAELLQKIEISKISRQLKSKLSAITNKKHIDHDKGFSPSVSKTSTRHSMKRYTSDFAQIHSSVMKPSIRRNGSKSFKHLPSPSSPLYTSHTPSSSPSSSGQMFSSPTTGQIRTTPLRNRKFYKYESLNEIMQASENPDKKNRQQNEQRSTQNQMPSILTTPKSKVIRTTRNFSGGNEDEGANLLMFLATSPSPFNSKTSGGNQFMSSPVRASKSYDEFGSASTAAPSSPHFAYKSFSSPFPSENPSSKYHVPVTPKVMKSTNNNSWGSTIIRTPNFNMSDYVNFMSPSPCGKKNGAAINRFNNLKSPELDASFTSIEKLSGNSYITSNISKDDETEDDSEAEVIEQTINPLQGQHNDDGQETEDEQAEN
ncbi:hypothetical protein DASC09_058770 [Saccharomycopsis crataegensis]|uniref:Uncharacterized protein n=1 Tax=Saccharomycopsis crataegensis TaxID=43959 RepID=A0AAV5QUD6_9ASCO|nr:hypothetical protein DASC09_058770 [Saccharomycopsis crataegensis]